MKIGNDKTSRGYCGWHVTWNEKNIYLRSKLEFIYALYLDKCQYDYNVEKVTYEIDNKKYKPDFFIYEKGNLVKIVEVKYSVEESERYKEMYESFFNSIGILYEVVNKNQINKICRKNKFEDEVNKWINKTSKLFHDMRGERNPHYGMSHSEETKRIIGEKNKKRFKDPVFRENFVKSVKESFNKERKKKISDNMKKRWENGIYDDMPEKISKYFKKEIIRICPECNKEFTILECYDKINGVFSHNESNNISCNKIKGIYCSGGCFNRNRRKCEVDEKRKNQINAYIEYYEEKKRKPTRKEFKEYCKLKEIPCDIRSTFGNMKNFRKRMEEIYGKDFEDKKSSK